MNAALRLPSLNLPFLIFRTILRKAIEALTITTFLYGIFFVILSMGGAMPLFSRAIIFHPHLAVLLKNGLPIAYAIIFALLLFAETVGGLVWLAQNSETSARLTAYIQSWKIAAWVKARKNLFSLLGLLLGATLLILLIVILPSARHVPAPPVVPIAAPHFHPTNRALLHFEGEVSISNKYPPMIWTQNISGPAKIKNLGDGRYLVQMIR